MTYAAMDIARYVINYCIDERKPISNLKLQKILYYIQAAFLVEKGEPCFNDVILKWKHGPVVVDVYNQFRRFIGENIYEKQEEYIEYKFDDDFNLIKTKKRFDEDIIQDGDKAIINRVLNGLIDINPWVLVDKTHEEDPWFQRDINEEITKDSIENYFRQSSVNGDRIYGKY